MTMADARPASRPLYEYRQPVRWIGVGVALLAGFHHFLGAAYTMQCISNRYRVPTFCKVMITSKELTTCTTVEVEYWTYMMTALVLFGTAIGLAVAPALARPLRKVVGAIGMWRP
jgi:hypothetical protein